MQETNEQPVAPLKKQRKRSPPIPIKDITKSRAGPDHYFSNLMKTPEGRALRKEWSTKPKKNAGRPLGVPDGHRAHTIKPKRTAAKRYATRMVNIMIKQGYDLDDEYQREALRTAVEVMRIDGASREKLQAARLVLDFTKSKPAAKSDVTINAAEDFLAAVLAEEKTNGASAQKNP